MQPKELPVLMGVAAGTIALSEDAIVSTVFLFNAVFVDFFFVACVDVVVVPLSSACVSDEKKYETQKS